MKRAPSSVPTVRPARQRAVLAAALLCVVLPAGLLTLPGAARAEYRAYQLEIVDLYDCRINEREECRTAQVTTALDPRQYLLTHGGSYHIGVLLLATWMCYGDTSFYKAVCPRPVTREPKFNAGDDVVIALDKHITEGWRGKVEVAYYQQSVRSNVYGVRFPERRNVYARYYEKDLKKAGAAEGAPAPAAEGGSPGAAAPQDAAPAGAPLAATTVTTAPPGSPPQATPPP